MFPIGKASSSSPAQNTQPPVSGKNIIGGKGRYFASVTTGLTNTSNVTPSIIITGSSNVTIGNTRYGNVTLYDSKANSAEKTKDHKPGNLQRTFRGTSTGPARTIVISGKSDVHIGKKIEINRK